MTDTIKSIYFGNLTAKRGEDGFMLSLIHI